VSDKMSTITTATSYITSGSAVALAAFTVNEVVAISGLVLGVLTFTVNIYYRHKHYKLEEKQLRFKRHLLINKKEEK